MKNNWKILQFVTFGLLLCALAFLLIERFMAPESFSDTWWMRMLPITVAINIFFILLALISMLMSSKYGDTKAMRIARYVLLAASVVYLGFVRGGCPCVLSYFQNAVLFLLGKSVMVAFFVPFLLLLLLTYIYGKVWCGWLCPLGGLQEFLYLGRWQKLRDSKMFRLFRTRTAQLVLRIIQIIALIALLVVLAIKQMPYYCRIDPFRSLFRLAVSGGLMWTLVLLLVVSSLLIYRPFCKAFCPAGLMLNIVSMIPGARRIRIDADTCRHCKRCEKKCLMSAIRDDQVDHTCIHCGECLGTKCKFVNAE